MSVRISQEKAYVIVGTGDRTAVSQLRAYAVIHSPVASVSVLKGYVVLSEGDGPLATKRRVQNVNYI